MAIQSRESFQNDKNAEQATVIAFEELEKKYYWLLPQNMHLRKTKDRSLTYPFIQEHLIAGGIPKECAEKYYPNRCGRALAPSKIEIDGYLAFIDIIMQDNKEISFPLWGIEMKKQGTNDARVKKGLSRQAIGNAACDRIPKNQRIFKDIFYGEDICPYIVCLNGCDFGEDISSTTISKIKASFGDLNTFNIKKDLIGGGGSCFFQKEAFTIEELSEKLIYVGSAVIEYFMKKYGIFK